jgi:tRNA nucleotidyltransferase (CCA-adding enzyme)
MSDATANILLTRFSELAAAGPLLARLGEADGVYLVGGAVRDLLLGSDPLDLDVVVDGELESIAVLLGTPDRVHDRFETRTVSVDGFSYDLARSRRETYAHPGALPTVEPAGITEDLSRRDFTVNALALGLSGSTRGRLLEAPHGREDVAARRLRVLHDRSFIDDPTRLLRLARYAGRLGFAIEPYTSALAEVAAESGALETVSGPRVGSELRLLAEQGDPLPGFRVLHELAIDEAIETSFGIPDERMDLAVHARALLPGDGTAPDLLLAVASLGVRAPRLSAMLDRLAFPAARRDRILAAAKGTPGLLARLRSANRPSEIAAAVGSAPPEAVAIAGAMGAEAASRRWLEDLRHVRLEIDGDDLLAAGVEAGPAVGVGLAVARAAKLDGHADGREAQLAAALEGARGRG